MRVVIGNNLRISEPDIKVKVYCQQSLVLDNPDYYKKERLGKWTGNTPKTITLYEREGNDLLLPFGCLRDIWAMDPIKGDYTLAIKPLKPIEYQSHINLYPYQQEAVKAVIGAKNGVLVMPCGSGKTQCGLEIISQIGGRALWLTHTQDLLMQSKKRAETVLTVPAGGFGSITAGKVDIGTHITFAMIQTMAKIDLNSYKDLWDIIVVDECQHCAGSPTKVTQFYKVVSALSARYKIGLTATPKRADGLERSIFALLGGIIHTVSKAEVAHTTCPVKVLQVNTGWMPDYECVLMSDGTIDYNKVIDAMIHDDERFKVVMREILHLYASTMVLANRVEYLQRMCDEAKKYNIKAVCLSGKGQSKKAKAERKEALEKLNSGEIDCIFATYQLAKEGLDVPNLHWLILATPEQDPTTIEQSTGRVGRKADGKSYGTVIDFVDDFGMYKGWWKKRLSVYKKIGCDIIE